VPVAGRYSALAMSFQNTVVAITGAAGGIGQELCRFFGDEGAAISAFDRSDALTAFADQLRQAGVRVEASVVDVTDASAVAAAFREVTRRLGPIDILINNAGATHHPILERTSPEGFRDDVDLNAGGAYNCAHAVLPSMTSRRTGAIVNVASVNGLTALGDAAYSAGKAALISLTKALALEYGRYNVRANVVCPGTVRTPIWTERVGRHPEILAQLTRWYPLGRIVEPIEVVRAVAFLGSGAASAITGAVLPVDCGLMAGNIVMARELTLEEF
jgi:NAD(P)-dependent dehydrogenase (short-subunit alcohol dehydrogenase family)